MLWGSIRDIKLPQGLEKSRIFRAMLMAFTVLACVDLLLYILLIKPASASLLAMEAKHTEIRKRRAEAVLFQKQKQDLSGFMTGIPAQKDMPLLVKELVQGARRLNLSVSSINYDIPKRSNRELAMVSFLFPAEGRYADVKRFIHEVETSDRLVGIQNVKLEGDRGRVKMQMKLITYIKDR